MPPAPAPVPLLLIADSTATCERIASALLSAPALYRIERITSAEFRAHNNLQRVRLALVDYDLKAIKQAEVVQQLNGQGVASVALVDASDIKNLQELILAGPAGLVVTPFDDAQLWETIGTALTRRASPAAAAPGEAIPYDNGPRGIVIAVHAPKGGAGASVIAANLAITLQTRSRRGTVLVEANEFTACQAVLLNLRTERSLGDLMAYFDPSDTSLCTEVLATHPSGLKVLLAPASQGLRIQPELLVQIIEMLQGLFDFVVVDLHCSAGTTTLAALRKANAVLAVIVPEMTSLHSVRQFTEMLTLAAPEVGLNIVLNRSNLPAGVPAEAIRKYLKLQVAAELPDDQELVTGSINRGAPFVLSHPRSALSRAIVALAEELAPVHIAGREGGGLGRLMKKIVPLGKAGGGREA